MKHSIEEKIQIPENVECNLLDNLLTCKNNLTQMSKKIDSPGIIIDLKDNEIIFKCKAGNKKQYKIIKTFIKHTQNIFKGVQEKYTYKLESANVHFPMSFKIEGDSIIINNFLGEKTPRKAKILNGVDVQFKGQQITASSPDKEAAGQTAANIEKATIIRNRDRRIFQDGIYITEKPGDNNNG